jgi:hypothetical protein
MRRLFEEMDLLDKDLGVIGRDSKKMVEHLVKKHEILEKYAKMARDHQTKFEITSTRADIFCQILLFQFKTEFEEDIAKIFSRLDDLETKIQDLGSKQ